MYLTDETSYLILIGWFGERYTPGVINIIPREHSGEIKDLFTKRGVSVRRCQVSQTPAFAITDYKAQGHTMEELEVDIGFDKMTYGSALHYKWTSLIQLRRATKFKGLCLRDSITLSDVRLGPMNASLQKWRDWSNYLRQQNNVGVF